MNTDRRGFLAGLLALPVILRVGARPEVETQEPRVGSPAQVLHLTAAEMDHEIVFVGARDWRQFSTSITISKTAGREHSDIVRLARRKYREATLGMTDYMERMVMGDTLTHRLRSFCRRLTLAA